MKINIYKLIIISVVLSLSSCKKDELSNSVQPTNAKQGELQVATNAADGHLPLTVVTIAGKYNIEGYVDAAGDQARFLGVAGIDLADDGSIYLADTYNSKIRKITLPNIVSTVNIPPNSLGETLFQPNNIRVQQNGTINITAAEYEYQNQRSRFWIVANGATTSFTPPRHNTEYTYYALAKDPYNSYLFTGGIRNTYPNGENFQQAFIEKFQPDAAGTYGKDTYYVPRPSGFDDVHDVTSLFCGYNAVKYIVLHSEKICKLTPSGVFQDLFPNQKFTQVSDIIANKDGKTLYIADNGAIKSIINGTVRYLVGPHTDLHGSDGVGPKADVYAFKMALSKDESTIYFTDGYSTVRKLLLL
ncbi:NHL repeat-containing protein [Mucilaginibacter agri]|uniref:NHL repeat-containing protein n=1 Tax=Mucilaginibacter agri TaxID=2695265 RepID=A0A966DUK5_9SPHI|nr:hypothetical protein [Mucilaginibacter agri]NCD71845.1 hypothetical protein [Mucilaginibacter agri]